MEFHLFLPQLRQSFERLEAVSLDHASGGRFELGLGWGSWDEDFARFGVGPAEPPARVRRMRETLEVLRALWAGQAVDYDGEFHHLSAATQAPGPLAKIPVVIGGAGPRTLELVRDFADWWNVPVSRLDRLDDARSRVGDARVSVQQMIAYVGPGDDRAAVTALAKHRFGYISPVIGTGRELADHFGRLADQGVARVYAWFCDFAPPDTLAAFGAEVISQAADQSQSSRTDA
jgi:alkanesulfonate monooxygenase SsuD/methylene tetrahydromethanopterin reductase-like flavin-dependent oxidoreductase (luciferase family)